MRHTVWAYAVVRVKFADIEADSHKEAMEQVENIADFHALFDKEGIESAEEIAYWCVDEPGDWAYERSQWYDSQLKPMQPITV